MSDLGVIKRIENLIGKELTPYRPDDWVQQNTFLMNSHQQVTGLIVSNNQISDLSDLSVLKALRNLTHLNLGGNQISDLSDLSVLKALHNLTQLNLGGNQISDLSFLKALPNLTQLNLSGNQISDLSALKVLPNLAQLVLSRNQIRNLSVLKALPNLTLLDLSHNPISDLGVLNALPNLTQLNLSYNQSKDLGVLKALPNLTELNLSGNQISNLGILKALPNLTQLNLSYNQIRDLGVLKSLPNLTRLDLSVNQISDLSRINALPNLTELNLSGNQISDLSALKALRNMTDLDLSQNLISDMSALNALSNLTMLNLGFNQISDLNDIITLTNLTQLNLTHTQISDISDLKCLKNLTNINLSFCQLSVFPEWILDFNLEISLKNSWSSDEKVIYLFDNPIEKPPLEIIKQGNEAIRAYFEQLRKEGFDTIYEAKLILVGEGGAGKTSLANKIINPDWQLIPEIKSESTKGIDILSYQFPFKDKMFRVNIWDFGGQEIYHQTHQFFLTKRALYFLLTDDRKEDTDFYHWLNIVDLLSANSPVVIIKNEKSKRSRDIPEQELKEFNNIKAILATDLSDNRGLAKIIKDLQHYITELPHIGSPLPKTWVKVRAQLEQDDRYHIEVKEYFSLCEANGFEKEADKLQLSGYLHDLGVCLHFQNHPLLRKTLILKPTWATDAVYKVLDNDTVKNQAGHFNDKDLADIWQAEQYNTMRGELLALMQKFKLCYEIRNQPHHYIAPQLLKDKAPKYFFPPNELLLLRYKYDFMPKGILSQFIVEMHEHIAHNYQWVWKSGVILEKDNTQAEIIEYYGKREIQIRVHGNNKKELLHIVSYELDKINSSYERLRDKCKKLIPCNCGKCKDTQEPHFYSNDVLKRFKQDAQPEIQCPNSYKMVRVLGLIDDIDLGFDENDKRAFQAKQHIEVHVHASQGNDMSNTRNINATNYVETMNGGNVAGRDINIQNNQGMDKEEFLQLLQAFKQDFGISGLPDDIVEEAISDIEAVEKQLQKSAPNKSLVSRKLESINGVLEDANSAIDTASKGYDTVNNLLVLGGKLVAGFAGFGF